MSARLIPPPQLHLHRITQYSQKNTDTNLLRAPSQLSLNRTKSSVRTVLGRALVRRREPRCASYTNTAVLYSRIRPSCRNHLRWAMRWAMQNSGSSAGHPLLYSTVLLLECTDGSPSVHRAANYCLSRTELSCQRPVTQANVSVMRKSQLKVQEGRP